MSRKIRLAIIKFGGLAPGGTEKFLQNIACNLDKSQFEVDYFYCDTAPYIGSDARHAGTDPRRVEMLRNCGVNLIEFHVEAKDVTKRSHPWVNTNFWEYFNEKDYDLIQTGRAGHPEYPFTLIKDTPIIDSIHLDAGVHNQSNIAAVMLLSEWSRQRWIRRGGDPARAVIVSHPLQKSEVSEMDLRKEFQLEGRTIFGMHQRPDDGIFSPIPLRAYKKIETRDTAFMMLGGSELYQRQALDLNIQSAYFPEFTSDPEAISIFLNTLDVYAHGRKDGEINSTAIGEALGHGLALVTHDSPFNRGHKEVAETCGSFAYNFADYVRALADLRDSEFLRQEYSVKSLEYFDSNYEANAQQARIEKIYHQVLLEPRPNFSKKRTRIRELKGLGNRISDKSLRSARKLRLAQKFR